MGILSRASAGGEGFLCAVQKINDGLPTTAQSEGRVRGGAAVRPSRWGPWLRGQVFC
jgi:hypothetical protein